MRPFIGGLRLLYSKTLYSKNDKGPKSNPWGIQQVTVLNSENSPLMITLRPIFPPSIDSHKFDETLEKKDNEKGLKLFKSSVDTPMYKGIMFNYYERTPDEKKNL